jgi:nicotinamide phosphoribosyltransferase
MIERKRNFILLTDAYKHTHWMQLPKGVTNMHSYLESRGGAYDYTLWFGLQGLIREYLQGVVVEQWMIDEAEEFLNKMFGMKYFNRSGWQRIVDEFGGKLPITIKAAPEGLVIPTRNILNSIQLSRDIEGLEFLVGFIESLFLEVWYPVTVATLSYEIKQTIDKYAKKTGTTVSPFHLNDFGLRGVSSLNSAEIGGAAHLVNFLGTDNLPAIKYAMDYYDTDVCGHSVYATEHSTTTIYTKDKEVDAYRHFLLTCPKDAIASLVVDSYDTYNAVGNLLGKQLYDLVVNRTGKVVVRPDSGNPVEVSVEVLQILKNRFGGTTNEKDFFVLNPRVGMIYGDGINRTSISAILENVVKHKFCVSNIVFGMGGALLQQVNRDTLKFAFKCSAAKLGGQHGEWIDVWKDPITDPGKESKRGRLKLVHDEYLGYATKRINESGDDILETVFENGDVKRIWTFDEVKRNSKLVIAK